MVYRRSNAKENSGVRFYMLLYDLSSTSLLSFKYLQRLQRFPFSGTCSSWGFPFIVGKRVTLRVQDERQRKRMKITESGDAFQRAARYLVPARSIAGSDCYVSYTSFPIYISLLENNLFNLLEL